MKNNASLLYSFVLVIGDALAITAAFAVAYILRVSVSHVPISERVTSMSYITVLVSLLPVWILFFALIGLYNSRVYENRFSEFGRLLIGTFIGIMFVISYAYITNTAIFPARLVTLYSFLIAFLLLLLVRTINRIGRRELFSFGMGISNVLIVGDNHLTDQLIESLKKTKITGYRVIGVVRANESHHHTEVQHFPSFSRATSGLSNGQLHMIIQTELFADGEQNDAILTYAQEHHVAYRFVPGNSELFVGNIVVDLFHSIPVIAVHQTALVGWGRIVKRLTDLFLGGLLLLVASPFMLLISIGVKLSDGGPVFFRQIRLTRYNRPFKVFKFRSNNIKYNGMSPEEAFAEMGKPELIKEYRDNGDKIPNDPRITRFGRFLRRTSLDELPQLLNVVKGDISLVGPRALIPEELDLYSKKHTILSVKSGLTGLAQVSGRRNISYDERRTLDVYYVQNWSFWGDLVILTRTISIVLFHKGAE